VGLCFPDSRAHAKGGRGQSWEAFVAANPDLFDWQNSLLKTYYREETLRSELARRVFVFPDRSLRVSQFQVVGAK
jgi:hypothetical protein